MLPVVRHETAPQAPPDAPVPTGGVDQLALRRVCGTFLTGVTVVTTRSAAGPLGVTVNSFTSVSLEPPRVLFCLASRSRLRPALAQSGVFAVNVLAEDQSQVCRAFASRDGDRFAGVLHASGVTGAPVLVGALATLECAVSQVVLSGDHVVVLGDVVRADVLRDALPLTFYRGRHVPLATGTGVAGGT